MDRTKGTPGSPGNPSRSRAHPGLTALPSERLLDSLNEHVVYQDLDHRIIWANKAAIDSAGFPLNQIAGRRCHEVWFGLTEPHSGCPVEKALHTGQSQTAEMTAPGGTTWQVSADPVKNPAGAIIGLIETRLDITERKRAEALLRESQAKYSSIVERCNDGIIVLQDGKVAFANTAMARLTGIPASEALGKPFLDFVAPGHKALVADNYRRRLAGAAVPDRYEIELIGKEGKKLPVEVNASQIEHEGKPAVMAIIRDMTERKEAETILRRSEENYRTLVENMIDIVFMVDKKFKVLSVNSCGANFLHSKSEEITGQALTCLFPEAPARRFVENIGKVFTTGESRTEEGILASDRKDIWIRTSLSPVRSHTNEVVAVIGVCRDVTDAKLEHLAQMKAADATKKSLVS